MVFVTYLFT